MSIMLFFCNRKTAYGMRISYRSSDVCSSDLIVAWRRPLAHHDLGNRFVAIDGADIDIVIEWIAPERIPAAPPPTAVEPPRRPPETVRAGAEGTIDISPRLSIGVAIDRTSTRLNASH